jgi:hypothetical protein
MIVLIMVGKSVCAYSIIIVFNLPTLQYKYLDALQVFDDRLNICSHLKSWITLY